jgi:ribosome-associated toxin RatA of RatAB toxin-antitoxin module
VSDPETSARRDSGPVVHVRVASDGRPLGASASARLDHPVTKVWAVLADVERYARYLPMVHRAERRGDSVTFHLRFKIGFFSVGFQFTADATYEVEKWLELRWTAGEPRDIRLRFELTPVEEGRACEVSGDGEFDLMSLGWLAKYFLRHHPEIQFGIFPGVALVLIDSLRRALADG